MFTKVQFLVDSPPRALSPTLYPWRQRLLVNEKPVKQTGSGDISPETLIKHLPNYDDGAYFVEYFDPETSEKRTDIDEEFLQQVGPRSSQPSDPDNHEYGLFEKFSDEVYAKRFWDEAMFKDAMESGKDRATERPQSSDDLKFEDVHPNRYGSYYVYEANNETKQFKIASFVNITSQDVLALYPQFMYEAVLKAATGRPDFSFKVTNHAFPITELQKEHTEAASGIFVCFVVGIGFALIPASIASVIVGERQKSIKSIQVVKGIYKTAYWLAFALVDLLRAYLPCLATIWLIEIFDLRYGHVWKVLAIFPLAILPFTYATSYIFTRESTAQTFTIYLHFLLSGIAGMIVFALRMVQDTALWGDRIMWIMRFLCPSFNLCNAIIFASSGDIMKRQRDSNRADLIKIQMKKFKASGIDEKDITRAMLEPLIPRPIQPARPLSPENIGGDILVLLIQIGVWSLIFFLIEVLPNGCWDRLKSRLTLANYYESVGIYGNLAGDLDEDVKAEAKRAR